MVSVIVPVYKVEPYLEQCISSITKQTYQNLEILLVDDGSPDKCGAICDRWAKQDARIRVIHKENGGLSAARNAGLEKAQGEYLCFVDSDDYLEKDMIDRLLKALTVNHAQISACNFAFKDEAEGADAPGTQRFEPYQINHEMLLSGRETMRLMDRGKYIFSEAIWNKMYKREIFTSLRFPEGKIHEDEFLFHKILYPLERVVCIPYVGYHYRRRPGSIMEQDRRPGDYLEALIARCEYLIAHEEQTLTLENERRLIGAIRRLQNQEGRRQALKWKHAHWGLIKKLFEKRWITPKFLMKRFVRCRIL